MSGTEKGVTCSGEYSSIQWGDFQCDSKFQSLGTFLTGLDLLGQYCLKSLTKSGPFEGCCLLLRMGIPE